MLDLKPTINSLIKNGTYVVVILVIFDLLAFFYYPNTTFGEIFLATRERTPLTWVSAVILFLISLFCLSFYKQEPFKEIPAPSQTSSIIKKVLKHENKLWYLSGVIFLFFSMDDVSYFHERLSGGFTDAGYFSWFPSYNWILLYAPLFFLGIFTLLSLIFIRSDFLHRKQVFLAFTLLLIALFLDQLDGFIDKKIGIECLAFYCQPYFVHLIRLIEEVLEVFCFGLVLNMLSNIAQQ